MSSDRELLEAAARAAGLKTRPFANGHCARWDESDAGNHLVWNPLTDGGDAMGLLMKLRLSLIPIEGGGWDVYRYDSESCIETLLGTDNDARRAITRAAAAMAPHQEKAE